MRPQGRGSRIYTKVGGNLLVDMIRRGQCRVDQIGRRAIQQQSTRKGLSCRDRLEDWICQRGGKGS